MDINSIILGDLEQITIDNNNFRHVISTTKEAQLVLMSLKPQEEIGLEIHDNITQFLRIESGEADCCISIFKEKLKYFNVRSGGFFLVPAGYYHNVRNNGTEDLKIYTIYSPPHHTHGLVQKYKPLK